MLGLNIMVDLLKLIDCPLIVEYKSNITPAFFNSFLIENNKVICKEHM